MKSLISSSILGLIIFISLSAFAETWDTSCVKNDCYKNGWTTDGDVANFHLDAICTKDDCSHSGWTSLDGYGTEIEVNCKGADCFKIGWHSVEKRTDGDIFVDDTKCTQGNCLSNGWMVISSYDKGGEVTCNRNNCSQAGGQSFWRSRRSVTKCKEHDCYHKGWTVHFIDPAVPPTY